jgi:hypothetical protein
MRIGKVNDRLTGKERIISHNYRKIRRSGPDTGSIQLQPDDINKILTQVAGSFVDLLINGYILPAPNPRHYIF